MHVYEYLCLYEYVYMNTYIVDGLYVYMNTYIVDGLIVHEYNTLFSFYYSK